jgi:hypothetical protein
VVLRRLRNHDRRKTTRVPLPWSTITQRSAPGEYLAGIKTVPLRDGIDACIRRKRFTDNPSLVLLTPAPPTLDCDNLCHRQLLEVRLERLPEPRPSSPLNTRRPRRAVTENGHARSALWTP